MKLQLIAYVDVPDSINGVALDDALIGDAIEEVIESHLPDEIYVEVGDADDSDEEAVELDWGGVTVRKHIG